MIVWRFVVSFLVGSIAFAKVAMLGTGIDITQVGSKNPGFNNVLRVSTKSRAALALVGDMSKGLLVLLLLSGIGTSPAALWVCGIAAVMGHCWSPFLKFNGGKGVAVTAGVLLFLEPRVTVACLPLYPILRIFGRKMGWRQEGAIASLSTMLILSTSIFVVRGAETGAFAYIMLIIVVIRHIPNLREIMAAGSGGQRA